MIIRNRVGGWRGFGFIVPAQMDELSLTLDEDFSSQLQALVAEAQKSSVSPAKGSHAAKPSAVRVGSVAKASEEETSEPIPIDYSGDDPVPELLRSLTAVIVQMHAVQEGNASAIARLDHAISNCVVPPKVLDDARQAIEQRNVVNKAMFDALHAELKGYKDSFIFDTVLKPVIRDLISLYDGTAELARQVSAAISESDASSGGADGAELVLFETVQTTAKNMEHHSHFILEVLERLDVSQIVQSHGKLDKLTQRAVAIEETSELDEDQMVVKVLKRGFTWRGRVLRPEDVIIKKWKETDGAISPDLKESA